MTMVIHLFDGEGQRVWSGRVEKLSELEEQVKTDNRVQVVPAAIQAAINATYGTLEQRQADETASANILGQLQAAITATNDEIPTPGGANATITGIIAELNEHREILNKVLKLIKHKIT